MTNGGGVCQAGGGVAPTAGSGNSAPARPAAANGAKPARAIQPRPAMVHAGDERAKGNGFALNLTRGGADPHDAEFERM